jgi:hypothetical protein
MSNFESEYDGLQPRCIGVDNSVRYQVNVHAPYDPYEASRLDHMMKLKASSKLFGYRGFHKT